MKLRSSILPLVLAAACAISASAGETLRSRTRTVNVNGTDVQLTRYNNGYSQATIYGEDGNAVYKGKDPNGGTYKGVYNSETNVWRSRNVAADGTKSRSRSTMVGDVQVSRTVDENGNKTRWWADYGASKSVSHGNRTRTATRIQARGSRTIPASE